jgi:hypothetical protein
MGEKSYSVGHKYIQFREDDDEFSCLCTFPHNDQEHLDIERLKSLAIFGAVVQLILKGYYDDHDGEYIFIPHDVPSYVLRDVRILTSCAVVVANTNTVASSNWRKPF